MSSGFNPTNTFKARINNLRSFWKEQETVQKDALTSPKSAKKSDQKVTYNSTTSEVSLSAPTPLSKDKTSTPTKAASSPTVPSWKTGEIKQDEFDTRNRNKNEKSNEKSIPNEVKSANSEIQKSNYKSSSQLAGNGRRLSTEEQENIRKLYLSGNI